MSGVNVFSRFYEADCTANGIRRNAALVQLRSLYEEGRITYSVHVIFFPHLDEEDYAVTYDAEYGKVIYSAEGRRSKKREQKFLESLPEYVEELGAEAGGKVFLERPLREAELG